MTLLPRRSLVDQEPHKLRVLRSIRSGATNFAKRLPVLAFACLMAFALNALVADQTREEKVKEHIKAMQADGSITNVINLLIVDGTFCAIHGHSWGPHIHRTAEYSPNRIGCRECKVCRLHQELYESDWR